MNHSGRLTPTRYKALTLFLAVFFVLPALMTTWLRYGQGGALPQIWPKDQEKARAAIQQDYLEQAFACAAGGNGECLHTLLTGGFNGAVLNEYQQSLYEVAILSQAETAVHTLLQHRVALSGGDAYYAAVKTEDPVLLTAMIQSLNLNQYGRDGRTPLIFAINWGDPDVVKAMLEHYANPQMADKENHTPLRYAAEKNNVGDFPDRDHNYRLIVGYLEESTKDRSP